MVGVECCGLIVDGRWSWDVRENRKNGFEFSGILSGKKMEYSKLKVWQLSRTLTGAIYELTSTFPKSEIFGLSNQMRRAAVSVPSNIAEGCGRRSDRETVRFLYFARGSLFEIETQCYLALDRNYIENETFNRVFELLQSCKRLLNGLIKHCQKQNE